MHDIEWETGFYRLATYLSGGPVVNSI